MSTAVLGPSDTTVEKPTAFFLAQSRMDDVSAPDCDTSASGPGAPSAPATLAFSCKCGRWKPRQLGPNKWMPSRVAILCNSSACAASMPLEITKADWHLIRPAISSAAATSAAGSAIMARSACVVARSAKVPLA